MHFNRFLIFSTIFSTALLISLLWRVKPATGAFARNGEIYNLGWIFSMPYDIGNTLRAPLAGPLSIVLTASLSIIMFFGLAASPVYYLLGTPKRNYHVEDAIREKPGILPSPYKKGISSKTGRSFPHPFDFLWHTNQTTFSSTFDRVPEEVTESREELYPDFIESVFYFLPEYEDENCKKLMVCHSHGFLAILPTYFVQVYRMFSSKMLAVPNDYQRAIQIGLENQGGCAEIFQNCTLSLTEMTKKAFFHLLLGEAEPFYQEFPNG